MFPTPSSTAIHGGVPVVITISRRGAKGAKQFMLSFAFLVSLREVKLIEPTGRTGSILVEREFTQTQGVAVNAQDHGA
jgi:hypothetical protein